MAEPSQTSVKRRRDEMSNVLQYDFQRCTELWYSDGNVILVAGSTGFRVYRGLLARQSQAFNDMFLVPQPADSEQIEGCPVVRLSDDTSDLIHAFRALFGGVNYFSRDERTPIEIIAALARVTHKYGMQSLREQVLNQLKMTFPIQLPDAFTTFKDHLERSPILMNEADVIVVINLARLIEAPSLLPLAFYGCCQLQDKLITGVTCGGRLEELSQNELLTCIRGKDQLVKAREAGIQSVFLRIKCYAGFGQECSRQLQSITMSAFHRSLQMPSAAALDSWSTYIDQILVHYKPCEDCLSALRRREKTVRRNVWKSLPELFGLQIEEWPVDDEE